jgi:hypothetical protein
MIKRVLSAALIVTCAGFASAQNFGSFFNVTSISGITVTPGLGTTPFTVSLLPGASLVYLGNTYAIDQLFGVYALRAGGSLTATSGTAPANWDFGTHSNANGSVAGWDANANGDRFNQGQGGTFAFGTLNTADVTGIGFHVQFAGSMPLGQTAYVSGPLLPVPEPCTLAVLSIGAMLGLRRRKRA